MRDLIRVWVEQLVFLILFVTVVEMMLPAGELRRYTKMVLGLVVILAVLDPLLQMAQGPRWAEFMVDAPADEVLATSRAVEAGRHMLTQATAVATASVAKEAETVIMTIDGVRRVTVDLDESEPRVSILTTETADCADVAARAEHLARAFLGVGAAPIRVEVERGGR